MYFCWGKRTVIVFYREDPGLADIIGFLNGSGESTSGLARLLSLASTSSVTLAEGTRVEHELMVQSRGGHSFVVTTTLEHSKKYMFQPRVMRNNH